NYGCCFEAACSCVVLTCKATCVKSCIVNCTIIFFNNSTARCHISLELYELSNKSNFPTNSIFSFHCVPTILRIFVVEFVGGFLIFISVVSSRLAIQHNK
ncbi:unnamed protein product, partial [Rotaria sp. Silwood2]